MEVFVEDTKQVLTRIVITEEQQAEIDTLLKNLWETTGSGSVLLIEHSGLLLSHHGAETINDLSVSSLVAGIFKSISALTSLLGEPDVQLLRHTGNQHAMILALLDNKDMLMLLTPTTVDFESIQSSLDATIRALTPILVAARESTRNHHFSFSKDKISMFLSRLK